MPWRVFGLFLALVLTCNLAAGAIAQTAKEPYTVQPATAKEASADLVATSAAIRFTYIVTNKSEGEIALTFGPGKFARGGAKGCRVASDCDLHWEIDGRPIVAGGPPFKLARGAEAELDLVGNLPELDS